MNIRKPRMKKYENLESLNNIDVFSADGDKIRSVKKKRICNFPKCHKVLSIYNLNKMCFAHQKGIR